VQNQPSQLTPVGLDRRVGFSPPNR